MKLRLFSTVIADIERIYLESALNFGMDQADRYQSGLRTSLDVIAQFPLLAREHTEFQRPVRVHSYESHLIVYVVDDRGVLIVRILHGHQNLRLIL